MADMDIEMDLDLGFTEEDLAIPASDITTVQEATLTVSQQEQNPVVSSPNDATEPNASEPTPEKVHLRGLDNLTTADIKAFSSEYYASHEPKIEWINDASANLVFETAEIAQEALAAFAAAELVDQTPVLQMLQAKPFPLHPETNLGVRIAVVGDRKRRNARNESRFYLNNPQYDPAERRQRGGRGPRRYRDREDGGYRSQRYDDEEQHKREREADFDVSLYDDDEAAIAKRRNGNDQDSSSGGGLRARRGGGYGGAGRELFPEGERRSGGRLRNRSASPTRDTDGDEDMRESILAQRRQDSAASANRLKAQAIKAKLRETNTPKELFPEKASSNSRSTIALDLADETADLFAHKMAVPFVDGGSDYYVRNGGSLASRIGRLNSSNEPPIFAIRGAARISPVSSTPTFNIKGAAKVKELFPSTFDNSGKELFADKLEGRGRRRQKAEDLFY